MIEQTTSTSWIRYNHSTLSQTILQRIKINTIIKFPKHLIFLKDKNIDNHGYIDGYFGKKNINRPKIDQNYKNIRKNS